MAWEIISLIVEINSWGNNWSNWSGKESFKHVEKLVMANLDNWSGKKSYGWLTNGLRKMLKNNWNDWSNKMGSYDWDE